MTTSSSSIIKTLLILFLVIAGLYFAKVFLMPLAIGGILATLFLPLCKWLEGIKVPKGLAAIACLLLFLIALTGIGMLLGWQISELARDFSKITEKVIDTGNRIQEFIFSNFGISIKEQSQILKKEQPSISSIMQKVLGSVSYVLTNFILVLVYIFLLLYYRNHIRRFIVKLTPAAQQNEMKLVINSITHVSQQYLLGLAKMIVCLWIMYGIGFSIIGVKNALFFAIICGLLEIIPFIGNITGTTLTLLVASAQGASFLMLGFILGTYLLVQAIQGWVLSPLIVGPQVKINPFTTIVVLIVGNLIWGIPGIFIAIPLIAMFKIVCDHIDQLKPYGFLIGEIETIKREPDFVKKIKSRFVKKRSK